MSATGLSRGWQDSTQLSTGIVFRFGGNPPRASARLGASCSANPEMVYAGSSDWIAVHGGVSNPASASVHAHGIASSLAIRMACSINACVKQAIRNSAKIRTQENSTQKLAFDAQAFLDSAGQARKVAEFRKKETIFAQGDPAKNVLYVQKGSVRLFALNRAGKEAVVRSWGQEIFSVKDAWPVSRSA